MKKLLVLSILFTVCGCTSYKIKNFEQYKTVKTSSSDASNPVSKKKSIIVIPFDESGEYSSKNQVGQTLSNLIEKALVENKYAKVEDRKLIEKLKDEIKLHEMNSSTTSFTGPQIADYAITGKINSAAFSQSTSTNWAGVMARVANDGKGNDPLSLPTSVVNVDASIKIVELPSLQPVKELYCNTKAERKVPSGTYAAMTNDGIAMKRAILRCVDKVLPDVLNTIKVYGVVQEKRVINGSAIFKIDVGYENGLKMGQKVSIARIQDDNKEKSIPVNSVYVSDQIDDKSAWLVVKNEQDFMKIKQGDIAYINMKYESRAQGGFADAIGLDSDK
ncbi:hypothetical protein [Candidatus Deianiraea vastatrix]|uniref:Uncharacterized protein n=1 Tax=Candidatus Deianiraea vastatrix TaxID=2163644 RepID=A0A5B8XH46_9RICK|nr:hypothetical protein [Candidatus Deianiraea vastatrix]QED23451.1 hypothetical protein Deia_00659 [Candidatus Deianiraea vastatrix]